MTQERRYTIDKEKLSGLSYGNYIQTSTCTQPSAIKPTFVAFPKQKPGAGHTHIEATTVQEAEGGGGAGGGGRGGGGGGGGGGLLKLQGAVAWEAGISSRISQFGYILWR